jgi:endonuclease G
VLVLAFTELARADYLEVTRSAILKAKAIRSAQIVSNLAVGDRLVLLQAKQTSGYYYARLSGSSDVGYVYRTFVRRYSGDLPDTSGNQPEVPSSPTGSLVNLHPFEGDHAVGGYPEALGAEHAELLENTGYAVGYSEDLKIPLWACYKCTWVNNAEAPGKRPSKFKIDERTQARVSHDDYLQSDYQTNPESYDRGHMAPNFAIGSRYGRDAQLETFLMSNVCPQRSTLNQQTWEALEKDIANNYSHDDDEVWVTVGPIVGHSPKRLNGVATIPDAFYAIIFDDDGGIPRVLALIMNQDVHGIQSLRQYVTTVDSIEARTGLDFMNALPDSLENAIESAGPDDNWSLDALLIPSLWQN